MYEVSTTLLQPPRIPLYYRCLPNLETTSKGMVRLFKELKKKRLRKEFLVTFEIWICSSLPWWTHYGVICGESMGVVSMASCKWKVVLWPSVTGLFGELALKPFGRERRVCVKCYLFFPSVLSHSSLIPGMSLDKKRNRMCKWKNDMDKT